MEGSDLRTTRQVAGRLGIAVKSVNNLVVRGTLVPAVWGKAPKPHFFRVGEVEAYASRREYGRKKTAQVQRDAGRIWASAEGISERRLLSTAQSAALLEVDRVTVTRMARRGELVTYRKPGCWTLFYDRGEVRQRCAERREARENWIPKTKPVKNPRGVRHYQRLTTIRQKDLHDWERSWGEWLTSRQVAFLLRISIPCVTELRKRGRLSGVVLENLRGFGRKLIYHRRVDVMELLSDSDYLRHHFRYREFCEPGRIEERIRRENEKEFGPVYPERRFGVGK